MVAALAHAERLLAMDPYARRRTVGGVLAAAREELLEREPELRRFG